MLSRLRLRLGLRLGLRLIAAGIGKGQHRTLSALERQQGVLAELAQRRAESEEGGGPERHRAQHAKGKLSARTRIRLLLDPDSPFDELNGLAGVRGDGVVVGTGLVWGRPVALFAQDFTVQGGSLGAVHAHKIVRIMEAAGQAGCPLVGLNDSGGARIQEGVDALAGYGEIFRENVRLSGLVPQLSVIMGPCAGGAVYSPALTDFVLMLRRTAYMFVTGPDVVKTVTHEDLSREQLGGAAVHCVQSGVAHGAFDSEFECLAGVRELLRLLPANNATPAARLPTADPLDRRDPVLDRLVPWDPNRSYDMREVIRRVADSDVPFLELAPEYAANIVIGFGGLGGRTVGFVGNQPSVSSGVLDIAASGKAARFVRFCNAFSIPIVTFVDVPGFLPGAAQEHGGIIRHGAKLLYAYAEATCPRLTVITRKAYGGAYDVMASKHLGADRSYAWPQAEIAVMGAKGADRILGPTGRVEAGLFGAAQRGHLDAVIGPSETRARLNRDLDALIGGADRTSHRRQYHPTWRRHGNCPL